MKRSATMCEYSELQFFRTTTGIQSGPDALDESRFVMTFLTILGVTEIRNFRLAPEGEIGKEIIKIRILRKVFSKQFALTHAEDNTSGLLN